MHTYKINWIEFKKVKVGGVEKEIAEGTFMNNLGTEIKATIWRFDKDGKEFPNWANIRPGGEIMANPWTKPGTDKITFYPPKEEGNPTPRRGTSSVSASVEKAQARTSENISKVMDRKEESIALASAQRDSVLVVTQIMTFNPNQNLWGEEEIKEQIIKWRNWFLSDDFKEHPPF